MQLNPVYLYPNKIDVFTNALASWTTERYRRVYNRNLKVYQGVDNRIDLQVRNADQKAADITGSVLVFNIVARETKDLVIQKDCVTVEAAKGKVYVVFNEGDLLGLEAGNYIYSIVQEIRETIGDTEYRVTSRSPLYVDSQYGAINTLEVSNDVEGFAHDSLVINKFNYTNPWATGYDNPAFSVSSIIDARPNLETPQSLHTFAIYTTNYNGRVLIQGSLDESATPGDATWVNVPDNAISPGGNNFNPLGQSLVYKNVVGKWNWFRVYMTDSKGYGATFTIQQTTLGGYLVDIDANGQGYATGEQITINGRQLGGTDGTNDLVMTVTAVNGMAGVIRVTWTGISPIGYRTYVISPRKTPTSGGTIDKILYR